MSRNIEQSSFCVYFLEQPELGEGKKKQNTEAYPSEQTGTFGFSEAVSLKDEVGARRPAPAARLQGRGVQGTQG